MPSGSKNLFQGMRRRKDENNFDLCDPIVFFSFEQVLHFFFIIEEQLSKAKITENDPTLKFTNKFQKTLCRLRKEEKFTDKEYFQIYPSDPIPLRLYGTIKAHKPEKNYPMRTIVSTIGTPMYGISNTL